MINEPTIHQIEQLLHSFRLNGGSDAEISALAQDIIRDFRPETVRAPKEVFGTEQHATIQTITDFKKNGKQPLRQAMHDYWHHWYVKYPVVFFGAFLIIFGTSNLPLYWTKLQPTNNSKQIVTKTQLTQPQNETSAPLEPGEVIPETPTLVIPKINVTVPIIFLNSTAEGDLAANLPNGVVHYYQTANPGEVGNTFITGHSSNYWWIKGDYNYIFANLDKLSAGDQAKIYYKGNKYLYQVTNTKIVEPTDMSVLDQTIKPTLTLMTCTPPGTSWKRLIVSLNQIAPEYKPSLVVKKPAVISAGVKSLPKSDSNPIVDWLISLFTPAN